MDFGPPGSSIHGIFQARVLEWGVISSNTDVYNGLLDSEGEGEGGMIWEIGILTCILSCKN